MADRAEQDLEQLIALLERLKTSINTARTALEQAPRGLSNWTADAERLVSMQQQYNRLLQDANRLRGSASTTRAGGTYTPTPAGPTPSPTVPPLGTGLNLPLSSAAKQAESEKKALIALENKRRAEERRAEIARKAAEEEKRLADARSRVISDPKYRNALAQAQKLGLGPENLQGIETRGGGIEQLLFNRQQGGINTKFRTYVNQQGGATPGISSQFRSFGSDILRDIGQFTKWSIAVAAVYTPLQKLSELMGIMVDNESRLADATVAANIPFEQSDEIFQRVAVSANLAGEGINTTIDAYAQSIRAAGRYNDEITKQINATKLLNDSLVLSKLSTLDQSESIDVLSAALLQSGRGLDQGQELLNKWVRVSQVANVDIATLATGVAVLGDAAETSGLSIDQLNGLIAVLSEQSISGSKEAANTAKALVGAYQSDQAEAALNRYGVALRKTNGEVRGFLEIYRDLARLRQEGVLSDAAVSEVALALGGGGSRRAKDASALINSQDRLNKIAEESGAITGNNTLAQDALEKKLQTVQTANTRLANSFQELAQTLGNDGGLLDSYKTMLNVLTGITNVTNDLFQLLGRSGPALATFATGLAAFGALGQNRRSTIIGNLGGVQNWGASGLNDIAGLRQQGLRGFGRGIGADILSLNRRGAGLVAGASIIGSGVANLAAGRNEQAIGNVVGGAIGAVIGSTLGGPVGLAAGAAIGSAAGDAMATAMTDFAPEWQQLFAPPEVQPGESGRTTEDERQQLLQRLEDDAKFGAVNFARIEAFVLKSLPQFLTKNFPGSEEYRKQISPEQILLSRADPQLRAEFERQEELRKIQSGEFEPAGGRYDSIRADLEERAIKERERQLSRLSSGEIRPSEFGRISQQLTGFPSQAIQSVEAYGKKFIEVSDNINSVSDAYDAFLYISTYGTEEQISQLSRYSTDIRIVQKLLEDLKTGTVSESDVVGLKLALTFGDVTIESPDQLQKILSGLQTEAAQTALSTQTSIQLQQLKLPQIVGSATEATSYEDASLIREQAEKIQNQFYTDMGLTIQQIEYLKKGLEDFTVLVERSGQNHFDTITGIDQKFWDAAQKLLAEQNKIKDDKGIGFQQFDIPMAQLQQLAAQSLAIGQSWQERFNYDYKPEDQIAIDQQGIVQPLHADFKILALLLEKIVDQNQKQLDGQYNIPEGATFWVPLTAAYYRNKGGEGGGLGETLAGLDLSENTSATDQNTSALRELAVAFKGDLGFSRAAQERVVNEQRADPTAFRGDPGYAPRRQDAVKQTFQEKYGNIKTPMMADNDIKESPTAINTGIAQLISELRGFFQNLFQASNRQTSLLGTAQGSAGGVGGGGGGQFRPAQPTNVNTTPTTKLDLKLSSNINLVVDGRILAQTVQSYLASELLRTEQTSGAVTRRYVI